MAVRTETFKVPAAAYANAAARHLFFKVLPALLAVIAILAVAAGFDTRWAYVLLIVLFVVYPMIMSLAWMVCAAAPEVSLCTRPQRWEFTARTLTVSLLSENSEYSENSENSRTVIHTITVRPADIAAIAVRGANTVLRLVPGDKNTVRFLIIPTALIPEGQLKPL